MNISERNFTLAAFGHHSSIRKRYVVDLPLFGLISSTGSSWSSASVGRATATLQKIAPEKWTKLTSSKSKHQITSWLDMEERWAEELRKASSPQKAAPKEAVAKAAADSSKKGQRVSISWQKRFQRHWKRLPKPVRKVLPWLLLAVGAFISGMAIFTLCTRSGAPDKGAEFKAEPFLEIPSPS